MYAGSPQDRDRRKSHQQSGLDCAARGRDPRRRAGPDHQEIVRILLDAGADASIGDHDGVTALEHAERLGFAEIAAILRSAG